MCLIIGVSQATTTKQQLRSDMPPYDDDEAIPSSSTLSIHSSSSTLVKGFQTFFDGIPGRYHSRLHCCHYSQPHQRWKGQPQLRENAAILSSSGSSRQSHSSTSDCSPLSSSNHASLKREVSFLF